MPRRRQTINDRLVRSSLNGAYGASGRIDLHDYFRGMAQVQVRGKALPPFVAKILDDDGNGATEYRGVIL